MQTLWALSHPYESAFAAGAATIRPAGAGTGGLVAASGGAAAADDGAGELAARGRLLHAVAFDGPH
jgi:hypothetical protein